MAGQVNKLTDTLKAGLINGDLLTNTPQGMTPHQANARTQAFFGGLADYQQRHAAQIAGLGQMTGAEARWAGVTQSEAHVRSTLQAIDQPGVKPQGGDAQVGRQSLGTAIADANQAGRLPVSASLDAQLRAAFPQQMPPTLMRAPAGLPEGMATPHPDSAAPRGRALRMAGAAGAALTAYDLIDTGHRVVQLRAQGNEAGEASALTHFVGRNAGGIVGGFVLGAGYGAATGSWTGPGAVVTGVVGGIAGAYLGDRWAERQDIRRVYTQTDSDGNPWTRQPEDLQGTWSRTVRAPTPDGGHGQTRLIATGQLANELNYRAANDSYSLGLAHVPRPQNPYRLDASESTQQVPRNPLETGRSYVRHAPSDAQTGQWSLEIKHNMDGRMPVTRNHPVSAERAAELEQQSRAIIAQNAANTPAAIAARYQLAYNQFGWSGFAALERVPPVIDHARAQTQSLMASDGNTYARDAQGEWNKAGTWFSRASQAQGLIREELNSTWQSQQAGLQELRLMAADARAHPTPMQSDLRSQVADAYARAAITPGEARMDAATTAVAQTHARDGMAQSRTPFFLQVRDDGSIATVTGKNDSRMEVRSVTTADDIAQAQAQKPASPAPRQPGAQSPTTTPTPAPAPIPFRQPEIPYRGHSSSGVTGAEDAAQQPARAQALAEPPNPWDQTVAGQFINNYMAALQRNDEASMDKLAMAYAQTPQFQEWQTWGQENLRQLELEQQQQVQAQAQEQQSRGISR
ncbi:MAG: hypothetical protein Q4G70_14235 [Pseudomonadota bacterium]|nr:hypothetical protein [Pseudomonadota bacterium]